jgi:hypothetical protein
MRDLDLICVLAAICSSGTNHSAGAAVNMAEEIVAEVQRRNPGYGADITQTEDTGAGTYPKTNTFYPRTGVADDTTLQGQTGYRSDEYGGTR